ncbi:MAG: TetR/AcrR family transcriptional regulator [Actinomycetales bacterium]|nr:TetR/AcrR family transcriptional regulator [Actinomycetales bacterium]
MGVVDDAAPRTDAVSRRRDAQRNYDALVAAAEIEFATAGPDVPLDAVVRRAGVGRGTLYRHFADRRALAAAIYERYTLEHEAWIAEHAAEPDIALRLLARMVGIQARTRGVMVILSRDPGGHRRMRGLEDRTRALLAVALERSQAAGVVAPTVTVDDLLLVLGMVEGALVGLPFEGAPDAAERVLQLVLPALTRGPADDTLLHHA